MTPERAIQLGVDPSEVRVGCTPGRHGGDWVVSLPDPERGERVLFSSPSAFAAFQWDSKLRRVVV